jgi:hypothetical protein
MRFRVWLEEEEGKDFDYFSRLVLGRLSLSYDNGPDQTLDTWEPNNLIQMLNGMGEYKQLPQPVRDRVEAQIRSRMGTLGDIIRLMAQGLPRPEQTGMRNDPQPRQNPSM